MNTCLECGQQVCALDQKHLLECCGLTLHEYALRHRLSLDLIVPQGLINQADPVQLYPKPQPASKSAMLVLKALLMTGSLQREDPYYIVSGEIRKLDQLLWLQQQLATFGFQFRQQFIFNEDTHRVVGCNSIKAPFNNIPESLPLDLSQCTSVDWTWLTALMLAMGTEFYKGYLFFRLPHRDDATTLQSALSHHFAVESVCLQDNEAILLRTRQSKDAHQLLESIASVAKMIPCISERYYTPQSSALVAKQVTFDAAHFITDHPGKCSNLHGGRYDLIIKIKDSIDPHTGFVIDYGVVKRTVQREVVERLDHKHLNLCDSALSWRSSSEYIAMFVWQQLIAYFPNLEEIQLYETAHSYCTFKGPTLDEVQAQGGQVVPLYFQQEQLGQSSVRQQFRQQLSPAFQQDKMRSEITNSDEPITQRKGKKIS